VCLFLFGGQVIRGFSAGLIWGIVIGTYSSIGLAVPLLSFMNLRGMTGGEEASEPSADAEESA
jgi:preprotein translocase subunit SecF